MKHAALGDLIAPAKVRRADDGNFPVLSMTMHAGLISQEERFKKRIASSDTSDYKVVEKGQLVVGFPINEGVLDFQLQFDSAVVSPAYGVWEVKDESAVDRRYLKRYLTSPRAIQYYIAKMKGSTARRRSLPTNEFVAMPVPLPAVDEQRRIAEILDRADAIRAKRRRVLAHLDLLTDSLFERMFGGHSFEVAEAGRVMPVMRNGLSPATGGEYPATVLTLSAITQGGFDPSASKIGLFAVDPPADKRVSKGDFLMCRGNGNRSLVGVGTYSREDRPDLVFPDTVIAGRVDTALVEMDFLEAAWRRRPVRAQIEAVARTTNGTYKVNQQTLSGILLQVPPIGFQREFADRVAQINERRPAVARALVVDDELFASLQSRAFRGEL